MVEADRLVLRRGGKAVGVVISMDELRYFQELEDRLDVRDAEKALADPKRIPYEEVRRKLGL
jgi:antitoxin Phd